MWPTYRTSRQAALAWAIGRTGREPGLVANPASCSASSRWPGAPYEQKQGKYDTGQKVLDKVSEISGWHRIPPTVILGAP
jgi:hypothetical protein